MNEFEILLNKFGELDFQKSKNQTFLEILSKRDAETLWSRLLSFYLNPNNEHGLNDYVLKSFLKVCGLDFDYKREKVETLVEYKFIDIVIVCDKYIIGIENKVNAELYNDLDDYYEKLIQLSNERGINKNNVRLIVLSKYPIQTKKYHNINYSQLISELHSQFHQYYKIANTKYLILLLDFIENIEKSLNMPTIIRDSTNLNFFKENYTQINNLVEQNAQYHRELEGLLFNIASLINEKIKTELSVKYDGFDITDVVPYYENDDNAWYLSSNVSLKNNKKLFCLQFDLYKNRPDKTFWNFYFNSTQAEKDFIENKNLKIDNFTNISNSLDSNEIACFFIKTLENSLKLLEKNYDSIINF